MVDRLAGELMDAVNNRGTAVKSAKTRTAWPKPTAPFPIIAGNFLPRTFPWHAKLH